MPALIDVIPMAMAEHELACVDLMLGTDPWRTLGYGADSLLRTVRAEGRERYVALVEGRFAGFLLLFLQGTFAGYIQTIGVADSLRGQGVGSALMDFAEKRIFQDHANAFLCVSGFNDGARRLYERRGYGIVGELTEFLVPGQSEWLMRKTRGPMSILRR
jgi:[ribosomal protein S18]-alanine N-acetyltransferase